jgi:hypothetical protein
MRIYQALAEREPREALRVTLLKLSVSQERRAARKAERLSELRVALPEDRDYVRRACMALVAGTLRLPMGARLGRQDRRLLSLPLLEGSMVDDEGGGAKNQITALTYVNNMRWKKDGVDPTVKTRGRSSGGLRLERFMR